MATSHIGGAKAGCRFCVARAYTCTSKLFCIVLFLLQLDTSYSERYVSALYFAVSTVATVGFGECVRGKGARDWQAVVADCWAAGCMESNGCEHSMRFGGERALYRRKSLATNMSAPLPPPPCRRHRGHHIQGEDCGACCHAHWRECVWLLHGSNEPHGVCHQQQPRQVCVGSLSHRDGLPGQPAINCGICTAAPDTANMSHMRMRAG